MKKIFILFASVLLSAASLSTFAASLNLQTGTVDVTADRYNQNWQYVEFETQFHTIPQVVTQVTTYHGSEDPNLRVRNVSTTGFELRFDEQNSRSNQGAKADGNHVTESVSWIAIGQ